MRILTSLLFASFLLIGDSFFHFSHPPSWKVYDAFSSLYQRITPPPPAVREIVIVAIDSNTVAKMKEKWPYSRATFARVITRLKRSRARAIALDFGFFGASTGREDEQLEKAIMNPPPVILAASLSEEGGVLFSTLSEIPVVPLSGIVNKLQDADGVMRRALTYLVNTNPEIPWKRFFSWELKLLAASQHVDLSSLRDEGNVLSLRGPAGTWRIPVDPVTKTFPIRFRVTSRDFERISFYDVLTGKFDPRSIENKMVLIGTLSLVLQDLHRTPIGWRTGIALNANTFLTLYTQDFLVPLSRFLEMTIFLLGMFLTALLAARKRGRLLLAGLALEIFVFFAVSYLLFSWGYTWNYALFPMGAALIACLKPWIRL